MRMMTLLEAVDQLLEIWDEKTPAPRRIPFWKAIMQVRLAAQREREWTDYL